MKILNTFILTSIFATKLIALPVAEKIESIPLPPEGKRWVLNETFSDEFDGKKLDSNKWHNNHPEWIGREPGLFIEENIDVKNGFLYLKGSKLNKKEKIFKYGKNLEYYIGGAAIVSKSKDAHYGYYECRVKANKTSMSTTFWLSTRGTVSTEGRQPQSALQGKFSQELDILECIGRNGNFSGSNFANGMNCNAHYWFTTGKEPKADIRAEGFMLKRPDNKKPSEDFNTYGCWWVDKSMAKFYLNNEQEREIVFQNKKTKEPFYFTEPMSVLMVVETYPFPWVELPNDRELKDNSKNTSIYDWVRAYKLVDINQKYKADNAIFKDNINFIEKPKKLSTPTFNIAYTASKDYIIILELHTRTKTIALETFNALSGYGNKTFQFNNLKINKGDKLHVIAYLRSKSNFANKKIADSFEFELN